MREWILVYNSRPWTVNTERKWHHMERAKIVKEWREAFFWLTKEANIPHLEAVEFEATPILSGPGRPQDVAAVGNALKAAVDGIVDAGVIFDDSPKYVKRIAFCAPLAGPNALHVVIREWQ